MKIKNLQISVLALLFGISSTFFSQKAEANNVTKSPGACQFDSQNNDDFSNQGSVKSKEVSPKKGSASELTWTFCGPIDVAGKTTCVLIDENDQSNKTLYVGSAYSGVWKSSDGGAGWSKLSVENNANLYISSLAHNPKTNTLYAGTEGSTSQGIFKSENGESLKKIEGTTSWGKINKLVIVKDYLYAATDSGLMCYANGAWNVCTGTKNESSISLDGNIKDIAFNKDGLIMAVMDRVQCYISKNGNPNEFVYNELIPDISSASCDNISVSVAPSNSNILYVVGARIGATGGQVYRALLSEDKGETWEVIMSYFPGPAFIDPLESNGRNINHIFADAQNPYILYIASKNVWKGQRFGTGLYDFGLSALSISNVPVEATRYMHSNVHDMCFYGNNSGDTRYAYIATDGGIYRAILLISNSTNSLHPTTLNKFLAISSYDFLSPNSSGEVLAATPTLAVQGLNDSVNFFQGARPIWVTENATNTFLTEGTGGGCAVSLVNERFYIYSLLSGSTFTVRRTEDRGYNAQPIPGAVPVTWFSREMLSPEVTYNSPILMWESFTDQYTPDTVWFKADTMNFLPGDSYIYARSKNYNYPIQYPTPSGFSLGDSIQVPDPIQNRTFYSAFSKVFMTREALDFSKMPPRWFHIATLESRDTASFFAAADDANHLFIGTRTGNVYCISNLKKAYDSTTADITSSQSVIEKKLIYSFSGKYIRSISVDPQDPAHVIVVLNGTGENIFETYNALDEAATFNLIKEYLPNYVYSVLISKEDGSTIVGTEKGIWKRAKGETTWTTNNNGMGEVPVMTLKQVTVNRPEVKGVRYYDAATNALSTTNYPSNSYNYLAIYAGTYGSGIFSTNVKGTGLDDDDNFIKNSSDLTAIPNPVNDVTTIELDLTGYAIIQIFDINGRCIHEQNATKGINYVNFKNYLPGMYLIRVIQDNIIKATKIIKK